jgi:hypothetical protein
MRNIFLITLLTTLPFYRHGFTAGRPFALDSEIIYTYAGINVLCCLFFIFHTRFFYSYLQARQIWRYSLIISLFFVSILLIAFFLQPGGDTLYGKFVPAIVLGRATMLFLIVWVAALLVQVHKATGSSKTAYKPARTELSPTEIQHTNLLWTVKADYSDIRIPFKNIILLEAYGDYVKVHIKGQLNPVLTRMTLKSAISQMPEDEFIQVHRSYAIRKDQIIKIRQDRIQLDDGREAPVGVRFRPEIKRLFQ